MSQKNKTHSEIVVLQSVPSHQQLMKTNRWLLRGVFFLMTVIFVTGFLLLPSNDFLTAYKKVTADDGTVTADSPQLSAEVNALKGQMVGLVSGSIESKLRSLEESLRAGAVPASLGALEDIKNDVRVLRTYSGSAQAAPTPAASLSNAQLMQEMSQLKRLIYWTLASCSLMIAAVAGIWIRNLKKLPLREKIVRYLSGK
ncbi:hypothetical protein KFZ76_00980 [Methylovulum psychrotolerans]|uniref:hypothetical protein n=1 Tax=Methylovulum psychrotolerans TaxID=1704499 RepID=UPI001BFF95F1|nr:hypothetical protein [Methylovulum psychrotolerans]MBT9096281.1 hypothetical protein [Methylovulum psychrotolerans]